MDTTGASASSDDSLRIDLPSDTTVEDYICAGAECADPDGTMIWDDTNGYSGNLNIDGTYLSLPVTGGTIIY